jgi:NADH-quinone oxidoreductase subunit C
MIDINALRARYDIGDPVVKREDLAFVECRKVDTPDVLAYLRDHQGYVHLSFITCVDKIEDNKFELVYMLRNHETKHDLGVKTIIDRENPVMESVHGYWAAVATYQRELREMFGIDFPGCPRVEENFALESWEGPPPMRRDFDTKKYSEETYFPRPGRETHDPAEHMKNTQYPGRADL